MSHFAMLALAVTQQLPASMTDAPKIQPGTPGEPAVVHWLDLEGDGDEDAVAVLVDGTLRLLRNEGALGFADETLESGLSMARGVSNVAVGDTDGDDDPDLILTGQSGLWLAENTAGTFVGQAPLDISALGAIVELHWIRAAGKARPDLHLITTAGHWVLLNRSSGFEPIALELAAATPELFLPDLAVPTSPTDVAIAPIADTSGERPDDRGGPSAPGTAGSGSSVVTPTGTGSGPAAMACLESLRDQATGGCLAASSEPTLGMLYPLSADLFVESSTGRVGIGTTTPGYALEVMGQIVSGSGNTPTGSGAAIGGGTSNNATGEHATIAGGELNQALSDDSFIGGGVSNLVVGQRAVIGGGVGNSAANSTVVGGGENNAAGFGFSTIAGGRSNETGAGYAVVGGGGNNQATGSHSVVGGGGDGLDALNANVASGLISTVSGGRRNIASTTGASAGGGEGNNVAGDYGTVAGGLGNSVFAAHAAVPGGRLNSAAGVDSMAAGRRAKALHDGAFVWADSTDADFSSTGPNQFLVRASGGMGIGKAPDAAFQLDVEGIVRASDTIVSTKPAGAPLQVASTSLVTNLNADLLDGVEASAFSQFGSEVDGAELADGAVTDAKVATGIAGTKIDPAFGSQDVHTDGSIGIRTVEGAPLPFPLQVVGGSDISGADGGFVVVGDSASEHLAFDGSRIQSRVSSFIDSLEINPTGGDVVISTSLWDVVVPGELKVGSIEMEAGASTGRVLTSDFVGNAAWQSSGWRVQTDGDVYSDTFGGGNVGIGTTSPDTPFHVSAGTDASLAGGGYLTVGDTGAFSPLNILIDNNEIMARDGTAASILSLNADGGIVALLGNTNDDAVGIGTSSPQERLDVGGKIQSRGTNGGQFTAVNPGNQSAEVHLSWLNDQARIRVGGSGAGAQGGFNIQSQNDVDLIEIHDAATVLEVNGGAAKPGGGSWSALSDRRLKKNVADLEDALETLLRLRGVTFEYIDPEGIGELAGERTGFIAQEVERVLPDWVEERGDGYKQLTIRGFTALAVEALRDLRDEKDREIDELRAENAALDARLEALEGIELELRALQSELRAALAK